MKSRIFTFALCILAPALSYGQAIVMTFTTRFDSVAFLQGSNPLAPPTSPYTAGQDYTFSFTLNPNFIGTNTYPNSFDAGAHVWGQETTGQPLYLNITGSGLSGTWQTPNSTLDAPASYISAFSPSGLLLYVSTDELPYPVALSVSTINPALSITSIQVELNTFDLSALNFGTQFVDTTTFFSPLSGTNLDQTSSSLNFGLITLINGQIDQPSMPFTITNVQISGGAAAIPEPRTYALIAAGVVLVAAFHARRATL